MPQLDLVLPSALKPGRPATKHVAMTYLRDLSPGDITLLLSCERGGTYKPLQRIRAAHHEIAILMCGGKKDVEISRITGRSTSNLSMLRRDPAFQQLIKHYSEVKEEAVADMFKQLSSVGQAALASLQEELETNPDAIPHKERIKIVEMAMDRTGHGPTKTVRTENAADAIRALVAKRKEEQAGRIYEADDPQPADDAA